MFSQTVTLLPIIEGVKGRSRFYYLGLLSLSPSTDRFAIIALLIIKRNNYQNDSSWTVLSQRQLIVI